MVTTTTIATTTDYPYPHRLLPSFQLLQSKLAFFLLI